MNLMNSGTARRYVAELIVVADDRERSALPEIIADLPVRMVDWQDTGELSSVGDAPVLVDVDLRGANLTGAKVVRSSDDLPTALSSALKSHYLWMETDGREGARAELAGADLNHIDLRDVNLSGANLKGANLTGARLDKALLVMSDLSGVDLTEAVLDGATLDGVNLSHANLNGAKLRNALLGAVPLRGPDGKPTGRTWPVNLAAATLCDADLTGASLRDANLTDTDFSRAILRSAILVGAKTEATIFDDADITGAAIPELAK